MTDSDSILANLDNILQEVIRKSDISSIKTTLERRNEIINPYAIGTTPLMMAAQEGYVEAVLLLLEHGDDVNAKNEGGETALTLAADSGHTETVAVLLDHGADVNVIDNYSDTPLANAAYNEHLDTLRLLLKYGADPDVVNVNSDLTPMSIAIAYDRFNVVAILLEGGADPNKADKDGRTPFMMALRDEATIRTMLAHGADVNWRDNNGISVLKWAHINCHYKAIPLLEAAGATL